MAATTVTSKAAKKAHTINAGRITFNVECRGESSATVMDDGVEEPELSISFGGPSSGCRSPASELWSPSVALFSKGISDDRCDCWFAIIGQVDADIVIGCHKVAQEFPNSDRDRQSL